MLQVFRFKTGGLNELVHILRSWKYFKHNWHKESQQHTFTVFQPKLSLAELHPLEGSIASMLTADMWRDLRDGEGRIIDKQYVLKVSLQRGRGREREREGGRRERVTTVVMIWHVTWPILNTCSCDPLKFVMVIS